MASFSGNQSMSPATETPKTTASPRPSSPQNALGQSKSSLKAAREARQAFIATRQKEAELQKERWHQELLSDKLRSEADAQDARKALEERTQRAAAHRRRQLDAERARRQHDDVEKREAAISSEAQRREAAIAAAQAAATARLTAHQEILEERRKEERLQVEKRERAVAERAEELEASRVSSETAAAAAAAAAAARRQSMAFRRNQARAHARLDAGRDAAEQIRAQQEREIRQQEADDVAAAAAAEARARRLSLAFRRQEFLRHAHLKRGDGPTKNTSAAILAPSPAKKAATHSVARTSPPPRNRSASTDASPAGTSLRRTGTASPRCTQLRRPLTASAGAAVAASPAVTPLHRVGSAPAGGSGPLNMKAAVAGSGFGTPRARAKDSNGEDRKDSLEKSIDEAVDWRRQHLAAAAQRVAASRRRHETTLGSGGGGGGAKHVKASSTPMAPRSTVRSGSATTARTPRKAAAATGPAVMSGLSATEAVQHPAAEDEAVAETMCEEDSATTAAALRLPPAVGPCARPVGAAAAVVVDLDKATARSNWEDEQLYRRAQLELVLEEALAPPQPGSSNGGGGVLRSAAGDPAAKRMEEIRARQVALYRQRVMEKKQQQGEDA